MTEPSEEGTDDRQQPVGGSGSAQANKIPPHLKLLLSALDEAVGTFGKARRPFADGPSIRATLLSEVRAEYDRRRSDATPDSRCKSFGNSLKSAIEGEMVIA